MPLDDYMLLSLANTKLRDGYSLKDFCAEYSATEEEIVERLKKIGYAFDAARGAFKAV